MSSRPALASQRDPVSKQKNKTNNNIGQKEGSSEFPVYYCNKYEYQKQPIVYFHLLLIEAKARSQGRHLKAERKAETMRRHCLLV